MSFAMVGYSLKNTVTENGYVSRGVCKTAQGMLKGIDERTQIEKRKSGISYTEDSGETWIRLPEDTVVSMNFWGFTSPVYKGIRAGFRSFFREDVPKIH